jgi:hypothetical protein
VAATLANLAQMESAQKRFNLAAVHQARAMRIRRQASAPGLSF